MAVPNPARQGKNKVPVRNPTAKSAGRALSTSFGSICYGSLIIALIQTLRYIIRSAAQSAADDGNVCAVFCLYCLDCCMAMIESLAEYFNHYAFTQVAIYGKDYCTAGKDTWTLIKSRGIDAIINDDLISNVLGLGSLLCGILSAAAGGLYLRYSGYGFDQPEMLGTVILVAVMCLLIGATEFAILAEVIFSGLAATFVCLAEDPAALQRTKPLLFQKVAEVRPTYLHDRVGCTILTHKMKQVYPQVLSGI